MKPNPSAKRSPLAGRDGFASGAGRGQVLIVEPDPLTQWSLRMYLGKWFAVDSANSITGAQQALETRPADALVVSDELPPDALTSLERQAHRLNARITIVRTVTDPSRPGRPGPHSGCLEKPFELAQLARLLGVPEDQLPHD